MLWDFLKSKMQDHANQVICEGDAEFTFEEIIVLAERNKDCFKGIKCCAIMCESELAAAVALLSCFAAKVTAVPLSKRYGVSHCRKILEAISPDAVIIDYKDGFNIIRLSDALYNESEIKPALIMCTSGTTGTPKGAMLTETNIVTNVTDIADYFAIDKTDSILISRPLYHCAALTGEFLTALVKGVKIRFYSGSFNPVEMLKLIKKYSITAFCGTPTLLSAMALLKRESDDLKHICISGESMSGEVGKYIAEKFPDADIYHIYGLTEACPRVSYLPPALFNQYPDCVGISLKSVQIKILSEAGTPIKDNEIGMLWVKGDNVMTGYYNNPELTANVIKDGWLCTGDLAMLNEKGLLKIKGRNDDMIIKAGMNIYPQEIESTLKTDARVKEALVIGEKNEKIGVQIVLNIVGDFNDVREVKKLCKELLPDYQIPSRINLVDELPKNASGKIIRRNIND